MEDEDDRLRLEYEIHRELYELENKTNPFIYKTFMEECNDKQLIGCQSKVQVFNRIL